MSIVRFDPFRELDRLQSEVNRLFDGYVAPPEERTNGGNRFATARTWSPAVDVAENPQEIIVRAALPGVKQDDIDIEVSGDTLVLRGERKFDNEKHKDNFVRVEHSYGRFQRTFTLGTPIDSGKVGATYTDGVLEIHLPKSEQVRPRKIQVKAGSAPENRIEAQLVDGNGVVENTPQNVGSGK